MKEKLREKKIKIIFFVISVLFYFLFIWCWPDPKYRIPVGLICFFCNAIVFMLTEVHGFFNKPNADDNSEQE